MTIRKLLPSDARFLSLSRGSGFSDGWTEKMIDDSFSVGNFFGFVAEEDGAPTGFITLSRTEDFCDIESVFVSPEKRRMGIAEALLGTAERSVAQMKIPAMLLEVRESNVPAKNLYLKKGFVVISTRKKYYSDGENAVVMKKEIKL